jgi:hypothetical protein
MKELTDDLIDLAHKFSYKNKKHAINSESCRCFQCLESFKPKDINEWTSDDCAICPFCSVDSVLFSCIENIIGVKLSDDMFIIKMNTKWFGN